MWQTDWAEGSGRSSHLASPEMSSVDLANIRSTYLLFWNEHCIECAVPDCYSLCSLYVSRRDRKCARFKHGIFPNPNYPGLFPFGAEVEFRRWGKLESAFGFGSISPARARLFYGIDRALLRCIRPLSSWFRWLSPKLRLNGAYAVIRERLLGCVTHSGRDEFDEFLVEVWNLQSESVRFVVECWQDGPKFRTSLLLQPGKNVQRIPAASMNIDLNGKFGWIRLYPENDAGAHVVFSWLDFVCYRQPIQRSAITENIKSAGESAHLAKTVKCVVWDLDQTAWDGILAEQDAGRVVLRPEVLRTMQALDERGILQSIASKNDHQNAWHVLERLGVAHLFLYPQINWQPKSASIERIVKLLNIGVDACAFIDDSVFERAEVAHELPGIKVLADSDVPELLKRPEFNTPVTGESRRRRLFYHAESQRQLVAVEYRDRYEMFLKSCEMRASLFRLAERHHIERCLELLHRSNQLNLSTYRYTHDEFTLLLAQPNIVSICTSCEDRFGDYGIVGFASVSLTPEGVVLKDFVLSCRVAQKKLENAWFKWMAITAEASGYKKIRAVYTRTERNSVLLNSLLEVGFVPVSATDSGSVLEFDCELMPPASDIVSLRAPGLELLPPLTSLPRGGKTAHEIVEPPRIFGGQGL